MGVAGAYTGTGFVIVLILNEARSYSLRSSMAKSNENEGATEVIDFVTTLVSSSQQPLSPGLQCGSVVF